MASTQNMINLSLPLTPGSISASGAAANQVIGVDGFGANPAWRDTLNWAVQGPSDNVNMLNKGFYSANYFTFGSPKTRTLTINAGVTAQPFVINNGTVSGVVYDSLISPVGGTGTVGSFLQLTQNADEDTSTLQTLSWTSLGGGFVWNSITTGSTTLSPNNAYMSTGNGSSSTVLTFVLPTSPSIGDTYMLVSPGSGSKWTLTQNSGQYITQDIYTTTVGTSGSLSATDSGATITLTYIATNHFQVTSHEGGLTVV